MFASSVSTWVREIGSRMPWSQSRVGVLWSAVATIESMRQGLRPASFRPFEGLRAGDFVHQVAVDVDERRAVGFLAHDVARPEFVVERLRVHGGPLLNRELWHRRLAAQRPPTS